MKSYPEMIAEGKASIAKMDERIESLKDEVKSLPAPLAHEHKRRIAQLEDWRQNSLYGVKGMEEYLAAHPELNEKEEEDPVKKGSRAFIDWDALFADVDAGMSQKDAAEKYECAEVTIYNKLRQRSRDAEKLQPPPPAAPSPVSTTEPTVEPAPEPPNSKEDVSAVTTEPEAPAEPAIPEPVTAAEAMENFGNVFREATKHDGPVVVSEHIHVMDVPSHTSALSGDSDISAETSRMSAVAQLITSKDSGHVKRAAHSLITALAAQAADRIWFEGKEQWR